MLHLTASTGLATLSGCTTIGDYLTRPRGFKPNQIDRLESDIADAASATTGYQFGTSTDRTPRVSVEFRGRSGHGPRFRRLVTTVTIPGIAGWYYGEQRPAIERLLADHPAVGTIYGIAFDRVFDHVLSLQGPAVTVYEFGFEFANIRLRRRYSLGQPGTGDEMTPRGAARQPMTNGRELYQQTRSEGDEVVSEDLQQHGRLTGLDGSTLRGNNRTVATATVTEDGFASFEIDVVEVDFQRLNEVREEAGAGGDVPRPPLNVPIVEQSLSRYPPDEQRSVERVEVAVETPDGNDGTGGGRRITPTVYDTSVTVAIMYTPNAGTYTVTATYWRDQAVHDTATATIEGYATRS